MHTFCSARTRPTPTLTLTTIPAAPLTGVLLCRFSTSRFRRRRQWNSQIVLSGSPFPLALPIAVMCGSDDSALSLILVLTDRLLQAHCAIEVLNHSVTLTSGLFKALAVQDFDSSSKVFN
jgi:hypothetical protein